MLQTDVSKSSKNFTLASMLLPLAISVIDYSYEYVPGASGSIAGNS